MRASFLGSDRTYGARRVWKDLAAEGVFSGLHRIERLMRSQALKARPRRHRLPPDLGERQASAVALLTAEKNSGAASRAASALASSASSHRGPASRRCGSSI